MGAEDFSFMLLQRPGCFFFLGAQVDPQVDTPHHSPRFVIDESAFENGVRMMVALAQDAPLAGQRPAEQQDRNAQRGEAEQQV